MNENIKEFRSNILDKLVAEEYDAALNALTPVYLKVCADKLMPQAAQVTSLMALATALNNPLNTSQVSTFCLESERMLQEFHHTTVDAELIYDNIALAYGATEQFAEKRKILLKLLDLRKGNHGITSFSVIQTYVDIAFNEISLQELTLANEMLRKALVITQDKLSQSTEPSTKWLILHLEILELVSENWTDKNADLVVLSENLMHHYKLHESLVPAQLGQCLTLLAQLRFKQNLLTQAQLLAGEAVQVCCDAFGRDNVLTRRAAHCLALTLVELGLVDEADRVAASYLSQSNNPNIPSGYYALGFSKKLLRD